MKIILLTNINDEIGGVNTLVDNYSIFFKTYYNFEIIKICLYEKRIDNIKFNVKNIHVDEVLVFEKDDKRIIKILEEKKSIVLSFQFLVHLRLQKYMKSNNVNLFFVGDSKDIGVLEIYKNHGTMIKKRTLYNYNSIITLTDNNKKIFSKKTGAENIEVLNLFSTEKFDNRFNENGPLAFVSRLEDDKGFEEILELSNIISKKIFVYGNGSKMEVFKEKVKNKNLDEKIIFKGVASQESIYNNISGIVITSMSEGLPTVFIEALAKGIPTYSLDYYTASHEIITEKIGFVANSIENLAVKINEDLVYNSENFQEEYKKYTISNNCESIMKVLVNENKKVAPSLKRKIIDIIYN